ncbi:LysE family translocator [Salipiger sp.]|uniref:LysE family translocator n=1 Tax=Salipiger sp. TaxID=2078585 RepID=UPI003A96B144
MDSADLIAFVIATTFLVTSPGPNGVLVARTVPTSGRAAGFATIAGFFTAFYIHGTLSILGISILLMKSATAFAIVKYAGAAYLCWIGVKSLRAALRGGQRLDAVAPARRARSLRRAYLEGLLTNGLNPKVSMFYLAVFPQFIPAGAHPVATAFELVFIHSMINVIWFSTVVLLLSRLTSVTRGDRFQRWLKGVTGAVFIGFGLKLASYRPAI